MSNNHFSKNFLLVTLAVLVVLTILIIKPLFISLASAAILAYLAYPVYKYINGKINSKRIASGIIVILLILIIIVPMYFAANTLTREGFSLFLTVKQKLAPGGLEAVDCAENPRPFCELNNKVSSFLKDDQVKFYVEDAISKFSAFIVRETSDFIFNLPIVLFNLFVMFFVIYFLLIDGTEFIAKAKKSIPLKSHHVDHIIQEFGNFTFATLYGNLIIAISQGLLGGTIFFLLGLQTPLLAGLGMAFFSFIPFLGTWVIWVPATIALFIAGETTKAIALLILGIVVIGSIDNILRPLIIGRRVKLHPAAILIGIIGGLFLMGPLGIIIGPLIISLLISFIEVYYKEGLG